MMTDWILKLVLPPEWKEAKDKLRVTNATVDYYERRELDSVKELQRLRSALRKVRGDLVYISKHQLNSDPQFTIDYIDEVLDT